MTLQDLIMEILEEDPRARTDDTWLLWKVYRKITKIYIPFSDFSKLPKPESVSRIRRHIQHDLELYLPEDVEEKYEKAEQSRHYWAEVRE